MSGHTPLSPGELARALEAYRATGTYRAAAAAIERDESTVRKALRRHLAPERAELHAAELDAAHELALRAARKARRRASSAIDTATDPRDVGLLAHVLHEHLRAVTAARSAHARLTAPSVATGAGMARVVEFDERAVSALSDAELDAELDAATDSVLSDVLRRRADRLAELDGVGADELHRNVLGAVTVLVGRTLRGDVAARRCVASLFAVAAEEIPLTGDGPVVLLPASLARPRVEQAAGVTVYMPRERAP